LVVGSKVLVIGRKRRKWYLLSIKILLSFSASLIEIFVYSTELERWYSIYECNCEMVEMDHIRNDPGYHRYILTFDSSERYDIMFIV
jgi:hypothetical protein